MKEIRYNAYNFQWEKDDNTFYAVAEHLYPDWNGYTGCAFPSQKRQFTIFNQETGGFRRFRFVREEKIGNGTDWVFESEDGILAKVLVDVETNEISDEYINQLVDVETHEEIPHSNLHWNDDPNYFGVEIADDYRMADEVLQNSYRRYFGFASSLPEPDYYYHIDDPIENRVRPMYMEEFLIRCDDDKEFANKWNEGNENILPN